MRLHEMKTIETKLFEIYQNRDVILCGGPWDAAPTINQILPLKLSRYLHQIRTNGLAKPYEYMQNMGVQCLFCMQMAKRKSKIQTRHKQPKVRKFTSSAALLKHLIYECTHAPDKISNFTNDVSCHYDWVDVSFAIKNIDSQFSMGYQKLLTNVANIGMHYRIHLNNHFYPPPPTDT